MDAKWIFALYGLGSTLAGVLAGAFVTYRFNRSLADERVKSEADRERKREVKQVLLILKALRGEMQYNRDLCYKCNAIGPDPASERLFADHCYTTFKSEMGRLGDEVQNLLNASYLVLHKCNADILRKIRRIERMGGEASLAEVSNFYAEAARPINDALTGLQKEQDLICVATSAVS